MLYVTTTLDTLHHDSSDATISIGEKTYHALTAKLWAWIVQSTRRAIAARNSGKAAPGQVEELLARGRRLKDQLPDFDTEVLKRELTTTQRPPAASAPRTPLPDVPPPGRPVAATALAEYDRLRPVDFSASSVVMRDVVILKLDGIGSAAFTPDEVAELDRVLADRRRAREATAFVAAAAARPKKPTGSLWANDGGDAR